MTHTHTCGGRARTLVLLCSSLTTTVAGCYASHGIEERPLDPPTTTGAPDASIPPTPDASTSTEPPSTCPTAPDGRITITYRDVPPAPATGSCLRPDGTLSAMFMGTDAAPEVDGFTVHLDACPYAFAACPCDITVGGVGEGFAPLIGAGWDGIVVAGELTETSVSLYVDEPCERCATCACPPSRVLLHAEDGIAGAVAWPRGTEITRGDATCSVGGDDGCVTQESRIVATATWAGASGMAVASVSAALGESRTELLDSDYSMTLHPIRTVVTVCPETRVAWAPAWLLWHTATPWGGGRAGLAP